MFVRLAKGGGRKGGSMVEFSVTRGNNVQKKELDFGTMVVVPIIKSSV